MGLRLPRRRRTWAVLFLLLVVASIGGHYGLRWYAYERGARELREVMAELDAQEPGWCYEEILAARPKVPDAENGFFLFQRLPANLGFTDPALKRLLPLGDAKGPNLPQLQAALEPYADSIAELRRLKEYKTMQLPGDPRGRDHMQDTTKANHAKRLLLFDIQRQALAKDAGKAADDLLAILQIGALLQAESLPRYRTFAWSALSQFHFGFRDAVGQVELPLDMLERSALILAEARRQAGFKEICRMDRADSKAMFDELVKRGSYDALVTSHGGPAATMVGRMRESFKERAYATHRDADMAECLRIWTRMVAACDLPPGERVQGMIAAQSKDGLSELGRPAFHIQMDGYVRDGLVTGRNLLACEAALHCEIHRMRTGEWPASIKDLSARLPLETEDGLPLTLRIDEAGLTISVTGSAINPAKPKDISVSIKHPRDRGK